MSKEKIIVALDVSDKSQARKIVAELRDEIGAFKIGLQLFVAAGTDFVREIVDSGVKVFLDLKFHDIPNTVANASIEAARLGIWMFNIHALGGSEMMRHTVERVREACDKENLSMPKIIAVTILTSSNDETLQEVGIENATESQVLKLARLASECKLDGVVASPREIKIIRKNTGNDFLIVTPGIRITDSEQNTPGNSFDDQKRILSPAEAVNEGANYLVIGRPILKAENPLSAAKKIVKSLKK